MKIDYDNTSRKAIFSRKLKKKSDTCYDIHQNLLVKLNDKYKNSAWAMNMTEEMFGKMYQYFTEDKLFVHKNSE